MIYGTLLFLLGAVPPTPECIRHHAAQEQPADGGGYHDQREGNREKVKCDEGQDREGEEDAVVERSLADTQDRLDHDGDDHRLHPVEQTRDRRYVGVGGREVGEQPQYEDRRYDEESASHDAAQSSVQPPADVGGDLLGLGAGQKHAEVQSPQVLVLGDPMFLLDQLPVHDRDLPGRSPEVDQPQLYPEPERFPESDRLDPVLHSNLVGHHLHLLYRLKGQTIAKGNRGYIESQGWFFGGWAAHHLWLWGMLSFV